VRRRKASVAALACGFLFGAVLGIVVLQPGAGAEVGRSVGYAPGRVIGERAQPFASGSVGVIGHGWGHGYGMGQWGALGYALQGETYQWILSHYYGSTTLGQVPNNPIRVVIQENDGNYTIVTSQSAFYVDSFSVPAGGAVMIALVGQSFEVFQGSSCAGPWQPNPLETVPDSVNPLVMPSVGATPGVAPAGQGASVPPSQPSGGGAGGTGSGQVGRAQLLQLCQGGGNILLRGDIEAAQYDGSQRTVNILPIESYLDGVVPAESPAYWGGLGGPGPQGEPWGFQELEAQAIAARSYALAGGNRYGYADICDTTACQVYGGYARENALSDLAVSDTAGIVVETSRGTVADTEFAASTGGFTKGGEFPAVPDLGDSVCVPQACNPNHTWTASIPVTTIESVYPQIGTLESVTVTKRDGNGDFGGRALQVVITGSTSSVSVSGTDFESTFGLDSDFFAFTGVPSGGEDGYWMVSASGQVFAFGSAPYQGEVSSTSTAVPQVALAATPDGQGYWVADEHGGVTAYGDAGFFGSAASLPLVKPIVGMAATSDGKGYWLVASDGGVFTYGDAGFYGSLPGEWVPATAAAIVPTPDGNGYAVVTTNGEVHGFGDAPLLGDLSVPDPGYLGTIVGAAVRAGT